MRKNTKPEVPPHVATNIFVTITGRTGYNE